MSIPDWLDTEAYPFRQQSLQLGMGKLNYVDEGSGDPVVMVHGASAWSFLYRHLIRCLGPEHRCVVPDHIGFGLSEKPRTWSYRPQDHAANLEALIESLGLKDITLVVHDYGGPFGLSYALRHPENVRRIVLLDTWMWSSKRERRYHALRLGDLLLGNRLGELLYTRYPQPAAAIFRQGFANPSAVPEALVRQYTAPFRTASNRQGEWMLAKHLLASDPWYGELWSVRDRIASKPTLIVWGGEDRFFGEADLRKWQGLFERARTVRFPDAGHFLQEENPDELCAAVRTFLRDTA